MVGAEMPRSWGIWSVVLVAVCGLIRGADGQDTSKPNEAADAYTLRLPVDEVVLTFNAMDAHGLPINDLKAGDFLVWDNGVPPRRIVAFDELLNRPIRAGILVDTSDSMQRALPANRAIAEKFVQRYSDRSRTRRLSRILDTLPNCSDRGPGTRHCLCRVLKAQARGRIFQVGRPCSMLCLGHAFMDSARLIRPPLGTSFCCFRTERTTPD